MGLLVLRGVSKSCVHRGEGGQQKAGRLQATGMPTWFTAAKGDGCATALDSG